MRFVGCLLGIRLYYYKARYYDPDLGRFLTADKIIPNPRNLQAFNRYSYVYNSPIKYTDPTGHKPKKGKRGSKQWKKWKKWRKRKNARLKTIRELKAAGFKNVRVHKRGRFTMTRNSSQYSAQIFYAGRHKSCQTCNTMGDGVSVTAVVGPVAGTVGIQRVTDDNGGSDIQVSLGWGVSTPSLGIAGTYDHTKTDAKSVDDLLGEGGTFAFSGGSGLVGGFEKTGATLQDGTRVDGVTRSMGLGTPGITAIGMQIYIFSVFDTKPEPCCATSPEGGNEGNTGGGSGTGDGNYNDDSRGI